MPKALDSWQVFPHRPLEKLAPNLWRVEGDIPFQKGNRVMTIARRADGGLVIHNAIALEDPLMAELEAWGKPAALIVPNGFHRLDAKIWKDRYPACKVLAPGAARKKVEQVLPVDDRYGDLGDPTVRLEHLDGTKEGEGVLIVDSPDGTTLVFNDAVNNIPKAGGLIGFFLAPTGKPCVPRFYRWMFAKDKQSFRAHLQRLAATPKLRRIIVSHGAVISDQPAEVLRRVAEEMP